MISFNFIVIVITTIVTVNGLFINSNVARKEMEEYLRTQLIKALTRIKDRLDKERMYRESIKRQDFDPLMTTRQDALPIMYRVYDSNLKSVGDGTSERSENESRSLYSWIRKNGHPQRG